LTMRAYAEACRALTYWTAKCLDIADRSDDVEAKRFNQSLVDLMIPIVKGWSTEAGILVTSLGVQVHGGMGYIEETGAAQYYRDSRISAIYEGTTGIQANDLVGRKVGREGGATALALIAEIEKTVAVLMSSVDVNLKAIGKHLARGADDFKRATEWIAITFKENQGAVNAGAVQYLMLAGSVCGGWMMARSAIAAAEMLTKGEGDADFLKTKIITARFFADHILPFADGYAEAVINGSSSVLAMEEAQF